MMTCYLAWSWLFLFNQKTAYEMRISDWSSDVCSSDLRHDAHPGERQDRSGILPGRDGIGAAHPPGGHEIEADRKQGRKPDRKVGKQAPPHGKGPHVVGKNRIEEPEQRQRRNADEHPVAAEIGRAHVCQSLMRISYAVLCLKKKKKTEKQRQKRKQ